MRRNATVAASRLDGGRVKGLAGQFLNGLDRLTDAEGIVPVVVAALEGGLNVLLRCLEK